MPDSEEETKKETPINNPKKGEPKTEEAKTRI